MNGVLSKLKEYLIEKTGFYLSIIGIENLEDIRLFNRYDAENITEELFNYAVKTVFSEPQLDNVSDAVDLPEAYVFAVEALPGQFDQRADSAAQCIQIISQGERPIIRTAKVYALYGALTETDIEKKFTSDVLNKLNLEKGKYFVLSMHREENVDNPKNFESLIQAINDVAENYKMPIIFSAHPRTRKKIEAGNYKFNDLVNYMNNLRVRLNEAINTKVNYQKLYLESVKNSFVIKSFPNGI